MNDLRPINVVGVALLALLTLIPAGWVLWQYVETGRPIGPGTVLGLAVWAPIAVMFAANLARRNDR